MNDVTGMTKRRLLLALGALGPIGAISIWGASTVLAGTKSINCTIVATYGEAIECVVEGGSSIDWGDGSITDATNVIHTPIAIGPLTVSLLNSSGDIVALTEAQITPDLSLECETGLTKPVYELATYPDSDTGWGYVYLRPDTGDKVIPGDPDYPIDPWYSDWDLSTLGEGTEAGQCRAFSQAAKDLGGEYEILITTAWEDEKLLPFNSVKPWSKTKWLGTQPGELTATVTVDGVEASERASVFFSGCN